MRSTPTLPSPLKGEGVYRLFGFSPEVKLEP
jgi:hypothetical protein